MKIETGAKRLTATEVDKLKYAKIPLINGHITVYRNMGQDRDKT